MSGRHPRSLPPDYFERLYEQSPDPWSFEHSEYEGAKYHATLAALGDRHYPVAFEVGCSIGVLTAQLADQVDRLVAVDVSEQALTRARQRCQGLAGVELRRLQVPQEWLEGGFDLILLSEVLYYLDLADLDRLVARVAGSLRPGGDVLLVHWTGATDYPLSGDEAAERFIVGAAGFTQVRWQARQPDYRLDHLHRPG